MRPWYRKKRWWRCARPFSWSWSRLRRAVVTTASDGHRFVAVEVAAGLLSAVNHSGDTDSTGAVCGNMLGALLGRRDLVSVD